ncbi:MAG: very short patch repair endonuclease [Pyrinomonadaceae bacterium]
MIEPPTKSRSFNMRQVRSKHTKPELLVRRMLFERGFRFRLHDRRLPGNPDIVLPKYRAVILVNGCFWHQHPGCKRATMPVRNADFWEEKLAANTARDSATRRRLHELNWNVLVVWECEAYGDPEGVLIRLIREITMD